MKPSVQVAKRVDNFLNNLKLPIATADAIRKLIFVDLPKNPEAVLGSKCIPTNDHRELHFLGGDPEIWLVFTVQITADGFKIPCVYKGEPPTYPLRDDEPFVELDD